MKTTQDRLCEMRAELLPLAAQFRSLYSHEAANQIDGAIRSLTRAVDVINAEAKAREDLMKRGMEP